MTRIIFVIILIAVATCVMAETAEPFDAEAHLAELEVEAGRWRSLCIVLGFTTAGGLLFILFTLFGNPPTIGG